jgi:hypothetical protein
MILYYYQINGLLVLDPFASPQVNAQATASSATSAGTSKGRPEESTSASDLARVNEKRHAALSRWNQHVTLLMRGPLGELRG